MNRLDPFGWDPVVISTASLIVVEAEAIHLAFRRNINSTMTFHASWNALFNSLATANESGNRNVAGFTGAMDFEVSLDAKMMSLNQPYGLLLVADNKKEVIILHNPHNFGGTLLCPTNKVGCLVSTGPAAVPVIVDHQGALRSIQAIVPSIEDIANCPTADDLASLPTPTTNGGSFVNLEALRSFLPVPLPPQCNPCNGLPLPPCADPHSQGSAGGICP
jgi:hypothetical protein